MKLVMHGLGDVPVAIVVEEGERVDALLERVARGTKDVGFAIRDCEGDLDGSWTVSEHVEEGAHVLLRRRCHRVAVRVRFGGASEAHEFWASASVGHVLLWAEERFGIVHDQRGQYRLKLPTGSGYLDNDAMLEEIVGGGPCELVLDLVRQEHNAGAYDRAALQGHLDQGLEFRRGLATGRWSRACVGDGVVIVSLATGLDDPRWIGLRLDIDGYPSIAPQGTFWDLERDQRLEDNRWPVLRDGNQAFRRDWAGGMGLYIACDRSGHAEWANDHPNTNWRPQIGIARYLIVVSDLLRGATFAPRAA